MENFTKKLTVRESEISELLSNGHSEKQIANKLHISEKNGLHSHKKHSEKN